DAINSVFPQPHIQLCIIHMVRNSLKYVAWKDYKAVTSGRKMVDDQQVLAIAERVESRDKALYAPGKSLKTLAIGRNRILPVRTP
ncbi:transposase, partial [Salmonella enterica subsp. enterica serovar Anatum]|nr:transposase [Salmonella enterica subsp. enterica serovar Anatum]